MIVSNFNLDWSRLVRFMLASALLLLAISKVSIAFAQETPLQDSGKRRAVSNHEDYLLKDVSYPERLNGYAQMSVFQWLQAEDVCDEFELTDAQAEEIEHVCESVKNIKAVSDAPRVFMDAFKQIHDILLPHQIRLLNQKAIRDVINRRHQHWSFGILEFSKPLELNPRQRKEIEAISEEWMAATLRANTQLMSEMVKLHETVEEDTVRLLSPEQKKLYREVFGPPLLITFGLED